MKKLNTDPVRRTTSLFAGLLLIGLMVGYSASITAFAQGAEPAPQNAGIPLLATIGIALLVILLGAVTGRAIRGWAAKSLARQEAALKRARAQDQQNRKKKES
jgi:hypothetical protein